MLQRNFIRLFLSIVSLCLLASVALAQDFSKTYRIAQGSRVSVKNVSGDVIVKGYEGNAITISGYKEGRDKDLISVEDNSNDSAVDVKVRYPERCNCNASIRFEVRVPFNINFNYDSISSVSGNVEIDGASGEIHAKSVSGEVTIKAGSGNIDAKSVSGDVRVDQAAGTVNAKSTSGNVHVDLTRVDGTNRMEFASVSGNVEVSVPSGVGADIEMSTLSGSLQTDFPITIEEKKYGPGRSARGRVGDGARALKMNSVSGNLHLRKM